MPEPAVSVDERGIVLPARLAGSCDVHFDEHHAWSFGIPEESSGETVLVAWPKRMRPFLDGSARVVITREGAELFADEVSFGGGAGRVSMRDRHGIPVMVDKWGLLQRPFSSRDRSVVDQMVDVTEQILDVLADDLGIRAWIAFGSLLGAAREGGVIGHDSDVDLAYLSHQATPAAMAGEMFAITRALRRRGLRVMNKSASFVTVLFTAPDGAAGSIDIYTCFYVGDVLYETATVGAVVPRSAIEPLGEIEFEGRMLPAPADPAAMLAVSYGPGWRVPDPSFRHEPAPELVARFDGWFSSLMTGRRDWETHHAEAGVDLAPSDFARWVTDREEPRDRQLVEIGSGRGADALHYARSGWPVLGLDYARTSHRAASRRGEAEGLDLRLRQLNLLDLRDCLTRGALLARGEAEQLLVARGIVEALEPRARENLWLLVRMAMAGGGRAYLEGVSASREVWAQQRQARGGARQYAVDPGEVAAAATAAGGRILEREDDVPVPGGPRERPRRWRMVVEWPAEPDESRADEDRAEEDLRS